MGQKRAVARYVERGKAVFYEGKGDLGGDWLNLIVRRSRAPLDETLSVREQALKKALGGSPSAFCLLQFVVRGFLAGFAVDRVAKLADVLVNDLADAVHRSQRLMLRQGMPGIEAQGVAGFV